MNNWVNYHHLYYFMTIAELGSVSKASEKLLLGQPTLSAQLKIFEDTLGVPLFTRQHKKLILTEQGKLALDYARNIFKLGGEMYEAIHDRLKPAKMSLSLGALDSIPKSVMLKIAKDAYDYANCSIHFVEGKFDELMYELKSHRLDIVVSSFLPVSESSQGFYHRTILNNPVGIYGTQEFLPLKRKFPHSLENQPFVLPTYDGQLRYAIDNWLQSNEIEVDLIAETQDYALKKIMALDSLALIPSSVYAVKSLVGQKKLYQIGIVPNVFEDVYLISSRRKIENPLASFLMKNVSILLK
jgi:LysR family transcriptional activator of nhaA